MIEGLFGRIKKALGGGEVGGSERPSSDARMDPAALQQELAKLDRKALRADGFQGVPLNRAGDLCHSAGEHDLALSYYGRAVDAYLNDDQPEGARAVGQKIIRLHPGAVRTYRTLVWLDLAAGHMADALRHVQEFVEASRESDFLDVTRDQLLAMAATVEDSGFRLVVADGLEVLEWTTEAERVRRWAEGGADTPAAPSTPAALRALCFRAALSPRNVPNLDALTGSG